VYLRHAHRFRRQANNQRGPRIREGKSWRNLRRSVMYRHLDHMLPMERWSHTDRWSRHTQSLGRFLCIDTNLVCRRCSRSSHSCRHCTKPRPRSFHLHHRILRCRFCLGRNSFAPTARLVRPQGTTKSFLPRSAAQVGRHRWLQARHILPYTRNRRDRRGRTPVLAPRSPMVVSSPDRWQFLASAPSHRVSVQV